MIMNMETPTKMVKIMALGSGVLALGHDSRAHSKNVLNIKNSSLFQKIWHRN